MIQVDHQSGAYHCFCCMKQLGIILGMSVHHRVTPDVKFAGTHCTGTGVERSTETKSCPRMQHNVPKGLFLKSPKKFLHPKSSCNISNLTITELFIHIFLLQTEALFTQSFGRIHFSFLTLSLPRVTS